MNIDTKKCCRVQTNCRDIGLEQSSPHNHYEIYNGQTGTAKTNSTFHARVYIRVTHVTLT